MASVFLVRHPATAWSGLRYAGSSDIPLSLDGLRQTEAVATILTARIRGAAMVVSSPRARAVVAARRIAEVGGWPIRYDERWCEVDFGAVEGATFADVTRQWPGLATRILQGERAIDWPAGETWSVFQGRVQAAWGDLTVSPAATGDLTVSPAATIVVTHGGPIAAVLGWARSEGRAHRRPAPGEVLQVVPDQPISVVWRWKPCP